VTVTTINRIAMILMSAQYSDKKLKIKYNYWGTNHWEVWNYNYSKSM
jgi:hypothetical protein